MHDHAGTETNVGPSHRIAVPALALVSLLSTVDGIAADAPLRQSEPVQIVVTAATDGDVTIYGAGALWTFAPAPHAARFGFEWRIGADLQWWHGGVSGNLWDASVTPYLRWRPLEGALHEKNPSSQDHLKSPRSCAAVTMSPASGAAMRPP